MVGENKTAFNFLNYDKARQKLDFILDICYCFYIYSSSLW